MQLMCQLCAFFLIKLVFLLFLSFFVYFQSSRDAALDQNEKAYAEVVMMADKRRSVVKELISDQEKAAVSRAEALVERLEREISDLRKREDELKQLSLTDDHIYYLQV